MRPAGAGAPHEPVAAALQAYEQASHARVTAVRTVTLLAILGWLFANYGFEVGLANVPTLGLFIVNGLVQYLLQRRHPDWRWVPYVFIVLDIVLLAWTLLAPGRTYPDAWPWQTVLRQPSFLYALVLLALVCLSFRPGLVLWTGFVIVATWSIGTLLVLQAPGTISSMDDVAAATAADPALLARYFDPLYVHIDDALVKVFVTAVIAIVLAIGALRARQLVFQEAAAARARANLARYVAPSMVERLAANDRPLAVVRSQEAAILFADMQGFTALAAGLTPEATMQLLREFHGRLADCVFAHGGTLDKFIGDGLMATFGTPETAPDDAARAVACALAMHARIAAWNGERAAAGSPLLRLGTGVHWGPVTMGDIGGGGRFEFAVIGDTVNTASRIERLTRELDQPLLISEAVALAAGLHGDPGWTPVGDHVLRGHDSPTRLWAPARPLTLASAGGYGPATAK